MEPSFPRCWRSENKLSIVQIMPLFDFSRSLFLVSLMIADAALMDEWIEREGWLIVVHLLESKYQRPLRLQANGFVDPAEA